MLYNGNIKGNKWNAETSVLEFDKIDPYLSTDLRIQSTLFIVVKLTKTMKQKS